MIVTRFMTRCWEIGMQALVVAVQAINDIRARLEGPWNK